MKSESLLILVTCIEVMEEWEDVWGFNQNEVIVFIKNGEIIKISLETNSQNQLVNYIYHYDVCVINGSSLRNTTFQQLINKIDWPNLEREFRIKVHRGGGRSIKDADFNLSTKLCGDFLKGAQDYSLGGEINQQHPVVRFAQYINNGKPFDNWQNYNIELARLRFFFLAPDIRPSILKHKIVNLLLPLQIDIEGLIEKDFDEEYWQKVVDAHKNLSQEFQNVKDLIYKTLSSSKKGEPKTIEDIISKITDEETKNYLNALLNKIKKLFAVDKDKDKITSDYNDIVNSLLGSIKEKDKNKFKQIITLYGNVYKKWMDELIDCIDQLMSELQE